MSMTILARPLDITAETFVLTDGCKASAPGRAPFDCWCIALVCWHVVLVSCSCVLTRCSCLVLFRLAMAAAVAVVVVVPEQWPSSTSYP